MMLSERPEKARILEMCRKVVLSRFHEDVKIQKIALVSTGGWWELENFDTVVRIVRELAEAAGVKFAGAGLRPHAFLLRQNDKVTEEGKAVLNAVKKAGYEFVTQGKMRKEIFEAISHPLIPREELTAKYNNIMQ